MSPDNKNKDSGSLQKKLKQKEEENKSMSSRISELENKLEIEHEKYNLLRKNYKKDLALQTDEFRKVNSRLSSLVLNLQFGILLEDENRKIVLINQKMCDLFDIKAPPESLLGLDCGLMADDLKQYFKNEKSFLKKIELLLKNKKIELNEQIELKNNKIFLRDYIPVWVDKEYAGHLWVYSDITEKIKFSEELLQQKLFYENILNNIPSDIAVFDPEHRYLFVNPVGIKDDNLRKWIIGKKDDDYCKLKGKDISIAQERRKFFLDVINSKVQKEWEEVLTKDNGDTEYHLRRMLPIYKSNSELQMVIGYGLNITVLRKAQQITEEAAKNKERFLANMSHEIRTPMNGILGLVNLLLKSELNSEQKDHLMLIQDSAQSLLNIINDILDMEKIGSGNIEFENIEFSLFERLNSAYRLFLLGLKNNHIKFELDCKINKDLFVIGDPTRFTQIINNLLSNAFKFTSKGKITISADSVFEDNETVAFKISVADTGIGIPANKIDSIFKPFTQADANTTRLFGGTGLGLSISKSLVDIQGGKIWVESELGKGSIFSFTVKYRKAQKNIYSIKSELFDYSSLGKLNVLLVEDNEINQLLAKNTLEFWGFNVVCADNGLSAIQILEEQDFDIILMDVQMPVINGIDTTIYIRKMKNAEKSNIPIIALTANAMKGDEKKYVKAGMNDVLTKPFKEDTLFRVISNNVKNKSQSNFELEEDTDNVNTSGKNLYDLSSIEDMARGNAEFISKMINVFIQSMEESLALFKKDLADQNWEGIRNTAHKIKPSITLFRIDSCKAIINNVEQNTQNRKELSEIENYLSQFEKIIKKVIHKLKKRI